MKVRDIIKLIEADGWYQLPGGSTSHRQFKHPTKPGRVTIAGRLGVEMPIGTFKNMLKQAGLPDPRRRQ